MAQGPIDRRQHGGRRIIAHRGDHLFAVFRHRGQNLLQLFQRIACRDLAFAQLGSLVHRPFRHLAQQFVQVDYLADPIAIGLRRRQLVLQLHIVEQPPLDHVDRNHLPRPQGPLFPHGGLIHRHHPRL